MATNLPSCFLIQFLEQPLKFLINFTLLKYVKSQRNYGFLIAKELIFGFQILEFFSLLSLLKISDVLRISVHLAVQLCPLSWKFQLRKKDFCDLFVRGKGKLYLNTKGAFRTF